TAPADLTLDCSDDTSVDGEAGNVTDEADNCTMVLDATYSDEVVEGNCPGNYVILRTWSLVDDCDNAADDQVQTITVTDMTPPSVVEALPEYFNGINDCKPTDLLAYGLSEAEAANQDPNAGTVYFADDCSNVVVTKSVKSEVGDDCGWGIIFSYLVADDCGNELGEFKIAYGGGDQDAPVLDNPDSPLLVGTSGWQCKSEAPDSPKVEELYGLYSDDCGDVTISHPVITESESNCDWYITYTYTVVDDCGNYADNIVITHTGVDTTPPSLDEPLPYDTHINGIDACAGY
ncbi:hypothetical protein RM697_13680, partial [Ichthyenterobacterium sp. W332]|nr:hypothetical protein [Ichthyenterobacterium sp. W332]